MSQLQAGKLSSLDIRTVERHQGLPGQAVLWWGLGTKIILGAGLGCFTVNTSCLTKRWSFLVVLGGSWSNANTHGFFKSHGFLVGQPEW